VLGGGTVVGVVWVGLVDLGWLGLLTSEGKGKADEIPKSPSKLGCSSRYKNCYDIGHHVGDIEISISIEQILQMIGANRRNHV